MAAYFQGREELRCRSAHRFPSPSVEVANVIPVAVLEGCPTSRLTGRRRAKRDGNRTAPLLGAPVEALVYARHGHELMG